MTSDIDATGPLAGERVLDLSTGLAGPFCAKLLADLGADVVKVERPGTGDPARLVGPFVSDPGPETSAGFLYVNTSKRSVTLDLDTPGVLRGLVPRYDVVIADGPEDALAARGLGFGALSELDPSVVLTTVSGFGSEGPYSGWRWTHLVGCALGAWAHTCGLPGREPLQAGGSLTDLITGAYAAVATLAAVEGRARHGHGDHVDVCGLEAAVSAALLPSLTWEYYGIVGSRRSDRATGPSFIVPCADGHIGVNVLTQTHWDLMCAFIGRPELAEQPETTDVQERIARVETVREAVAAALADRPAEEIFHEAQLWRLPFGMLVSPAQLLRLRAHDERGYFVGLEHPVAGKLRVPRLPFLMSATPARTTRAPTLGEHNSELGQAVRGVSRAKETTSQTGRPPLHGVRIVDLSMFMAGPFVTLFAADMGADVIKVESVQRIDGWRANLMRGVERQWEAAPSFNWINRNKRGITLNLADPRGAELLKRLVATSDAVVENYTPRVMEGFGLGYDELRRVNPRIVMLSMPGFGLTGPWRDYSAFAWTTEQMGGICHLTGYEDSGPLFTATVGGDTLAGLMGTLALVAAINHQRRTGEGQLIDLSQAEAAASFVGDVLVHTAATGIDTTRRGNRSDTMAPHGIYPCLDDTWIAIACRSDEEWSTLARLLDLSRTDLDRYASVDRRLADARALDDVVSRWTATQDGNALMHRLQAAGVAAGAVLTGKDLLEDPHLTKRGFFIPQDRAEIGVKHYPGQPFRFAGATLPEPARAPYLGESNEDVLGGLLGLGAGELAALERDDVIGTVPIEARQVPVTEGRG